MIDNLIKTRFWNDHKANHLPFLSFEIDDNDSTNKAIDRLLKFFYEKNDENSEKINKQIKKLKESKKNPLTLSKSIQKLKQIINISSFKNKDILDLILEDDWRPQLVAGIICLMVENVEENIINSIWCKIEKNTWVSPQLLVILTIIDEDCGVKSFNLLKQRIQDFKNNEKLIGALIYISKKCDIEINTVISQEKYTPLLEFKNNDGFNIAKKWDENLKKNWVLIIN